MAGDAMPTGKVIVIAGPTASGKSALGLRVCELLKGEIVSADSVQVYRKLVIGANKPSAAERETIRHHLVDIVDLNEEFSAGDFVRAAHAAIDDILSRNRVPVVVGGTMMYVEWLVRGPPSAPAATAAVSAAAERLLAAAAAAGDWAAGLAVLAARDAERADKLNANDWYRLRRALEVSLSGGEWTGERRPLERAYDFRCFFLAGDRVAAARRIDARCDEMLRRGLLRETAALLASGELRPDSMPARAIGYRQVIELLEQLGYTSTSNASALGLRPRAQLPASSVGAVGRYAGDAPSAAEAAAAEEGASCASAVATIGKRALSDADDGEFEAGNAAVVALDSTHLAAVLEEFRASFASRTRQYAQGQYKWFRGAKGADFVWLPIGGAAEAATANRIAAAVAAAATEESAGVRQSAEALPAGVSSTKSEVFRTSAGSEGSVAAATAALVALYRCDRPTYEKVCLDALQARLRAEHVERGKAMKTYQAELPAYSGLKSEFEAALALLLPVGQKKEASGGSR